MKYIWFDLAVPVFTTGGPTSTNCSVASLHLCACLTKWKHGEIKKYIQNYLL